MGTLHAYRSYIEHNGMSSSVRPELAVSVAALATSGVLGAQPPRDHRRVRLLGLTSTSSFIRSRREYIDRDDGSRRPSGAVLRRVHAAHAGRLVDSTRDIITHMLSARTPGRDFIGPPVC